MMEPLGVCPNLWVSKAIRDAVAKNVAPSRSTDKGTGGLADFYIRGLLDPGKRYSPSPPPLRRGRSNDSTQFSALADMKR